MCLIHETIIFSLMSTRLEELDTSGKKRNQGMSNALQVFLKNMHKEPLNGSLMEAVCLYGANGHHVTHPQIIESS